MALTTEQERYLVALLDKSEEDLLFEVAYDTTKNIKASTGNTRAYEQRSAKSFSHPSPAQLTRVPNAPVQAELKPVLVTFLGSARKRVEAFHSRIYGWLCDGATQTPNTLVLDIATGQRKDVIAAVATYLMSKYNTEMSLAIPVAVFYLKAGLVAFCGTKPAPIQPSGR